MSSRPRRSAAQRATEAITDMADRDNERAMSSRARRSGGLASVSRDPPSSTASSPADSGQHIHLTVKVPSNKLRQVTGGNKRSSSGTTARGSYARSSTAAAAAGKRSRGPKKSYVVESDSDEEDEEDEEEEGEDEIEVGNRAGLVDLEGDEDDDDDEEMDDDEDAEGEVDDEMDLDAEGEEEDADGDIDMDIAPPPPPAITISRPPKTTPAKKGVAIHKPSGKAAAAPKDDEDDDDDDELSELESEPEATELLGGDEDAEGEDEEVDIDAEGEEIEVVDEDAEGEDEELDSDDGSRAGTPDLTKLTARQRAKLGDASHEYLKLSDEVQAKKVFTAEELSMRRAEMARRRRNLSEKRNEEVKMETINKLLKKQAPKTNRRSALAGDETPDSEQMQRADPLFVRWVNNKEGSRVGVPDDMLIGPVGRVFKGKLGSGKMVEEVS
ncbi:PAPA-1-like conserved region-domain-containing protein [Echria macrotheca]|uniref:PAPA-1-like conserved region-domain-containing protein n=1 Tax=Echria macrotheca TaxID=438768 RepID=A0AAJ0FAM5_9PEZI|nr:PAPA-1-like conserved region-domain-containing protein [Echria macrotheca]